MTKVILFDLDGTLLNNKMETFLPKYLEALTARVAHLIPPHRFVEQLLSSTKAMTKNTDPIKTNRQVFMEDFFPKLGHPPEALIPIFDDFYAHDFGCLRIYTRTKPEARAIVEEVFAQDYTVVIATNPLFPLTAIEQRLEWAGVGDFDYALITAYENMHTCKPHLAYYREILDKIDCRAEDCLMVGNDFEEDIVPVAKLGISSFWVTDAKPDITKLTLRADLQGTLADFGKLVESGRLQEVLGGQK
ncbi:MAG: HAD family hydrolase [Anaerolineae bacterium]